MDEELTKSQLTTWRAMEALVRSGKTRAIGVSNFNVDQLEEILSFAEIIPSCCQVESHPYFPQTKLVEFCKENGIAFVAYSPLGSQPSALTKVSRKVLDDKTIVEVARKLGREPAQVVLAWASESTPNNFLPRGVC